MLTFGDAGHGCAGFTLAAGGEYDDAVTRQRVEGHGPEEGRAAVEIAELARHLDGALHGAAGNDDSSACRHGSLGHRAQTCDVGREGRDHHAALRAGDDVGQRGAHIRLRRALALAHDVGGIADERQHALVADFTQALLVRGQADHRPLVALPVAGMQHRANRRADSERVALGDGMGHWDILDVEGAELDARALRHHLEIDLRSAWL